MSLERERNRRVRFQDKPLETPPSTMRLINQNKGIFHLIVLKSSMFKVPMFSNDLLSFIKKKDSKDYNSSKEDYLSN